MKRHLSYTYITFAFLVLTGCADIIEQDLTGFGVVLLTPPDGHSTPSNVIEFRWEEVPRATEYRLQVATPSFENPVLFRFDTVITSTVFSAPLQPGPYHWRVRAQNGSSRTDYFERSLEVLEAGSLVDLSPLLLAPGANTYLSVQAIPFSWSPLNGAADYRFELRNGGQTGPLVTAQITNGVSLVLEDLDEGSFTWGVQAQNSSSSSQFSYRSLQVDRTAPGAPVLNQPALNATLPNSTAQFLWQSGTDTSPTTDSLIIRDDQGQIVRGLSLGLATYSDSLGLGSFTWLVRTIDAAGNGTSSAQRSFTIQ